MICNILWVMCSFLGWGQNSQSGPCIRNESEEPSLHPQKRHSDKKAKDKIAQGDKEPWRLRWCLSITKKGHRVISLGLFLLDHLLFFFFFSFHGHSLLMFPCASHFHCLGPPLPWEVFFCFLMTQWGRMGWGVEASTSPDLQVLSVCLSWLWFCLVLPLMAIRVLEIEGLRAKEIRDPLSLSSVQGSISQSVFMIVTGQKRVSRSC